jgi:hypothetical protein
MKITFEANELSVFVRELEDWYRRKNFYVFDHLRYIESPLSHFDNGGRVEMQAQVQRLQKEFAEKNPKPDWRVFLK